MSEEVLKLWPELEWIADKDLMEKTAAVWDLALERSVLTAADLQKKKKNKHNVFVKWIVLSVLPISSH